ncbi:MAG: glycosyltransferase [Candidatus Nanopelagicales bacterium]|nr:glycosyltransferase [Candidatus Nanopelagicales bacterium]
MPALLIDVTDLVEFLQRRESVSGVQRVIAEVAPLLPTSAGATVHAVVLDRGRGAFVALEPAEQQVLVVRGARAGSDATRDELAAAAGSVLDRARAATPIGISPGDVLLFLGALWINDALMLAARDAHARGAILVDLLYDLTPVLQTGHTAAVNRLFERYLTLVCQTASRVPAISQSSRRDFERYAAEHGCLPIPGEATGLPCGLTPATFGAGTAHESPWPRPFALFVGTVESRKNHLLALRGWQALIERHGAESVPDLVCVGRLGWHATEFLTEYVRTHGLDGRLSVLSASVSDQELADLYAHAEFTVYPSNYEGWGLPVSESLAFGKVPVVADNSSLREAGGDLAVYFPTDDIGAFVTAVESVLDVEHRAMLEQRIAASQAPPITWQHVAAVIASEIAAAQAAGVRQPVIPAVELGREYMLAVGGPAPDSGYADQVLDHLQAEGLTPMLRQPRGERDFEIVDAAVIGSFGSPQAWGNELHPGRRAQFRIERPVPGPLVLLIATRSMPGVAIIDAAGPGGPVREEVYLGSVIRLPLGDGRAGEPAQVSLSVIDAHDSLEGFVGLRSFVVLKADDLTAEVHAYRSAATALRQELDFIQGSRSWKVTVPLRRLKGRGAN